MKRPTQVDVARLAGVSRTTVSYVVNDRAGDQIPISEETRQRVLEAIEELGYEPDARARALRSGRTKAIGLIIPDIRNPHYWDTAAGAEQEARASGYHLILSSADLNPEFGKEAFKDLSGRRIDGLVLMGAFIFQSEEAHKTLTRLLKRRFPIVKLAEHPDTDCVVAAYDEATKEMMSYLLSLHHRRIGLIYGVLPYQHSLLAADLPVEYEGGQDRLLSYQDSLRAAGLPVDPELIVTCGPDIEDGYQAALQLLKLPSRPTALIVINDLLAIGAMRAARDLGLQVPKDLSLASYDDILVAKYLVPRLTTVSKDPVRLGREGVKLLLARIQEPSGPRQTVNIPARLIIRESTGPAPF
jgi:LacI family transcriptional regulator